MRILRNLCSLLILFSTACQGGNSAPTAPVISIPLPSTVSPVHTPILPAIWTATPALPPTPSIPTPTAAGAAYYVATDGDDHNPGTLALPWRSIQHAADHLQDGETVFIRGGTYYEQVRPQHSGAQGAYITYTAYPGEVVTLDGSGMQMPSWEGQFYIDEQHYIRVSGLRVINTSAIGILADGGNHLIFDHNTTHNTYSSGIGAWNGYDVLVEYNEIVLACNDGEQEDITILGIDTFEVRFNQVHDGGPGTRGGEGIDVKDGSANGSVHHNLVYNLQRLGIYVDAWDRHTHNIHVYANVVHDMNAFGYAVSSEMGGLLEDVYIYNNLAYHNADCGLSISNWGDAPSHPMNNIQIVNNTFFANGWSGWGGGICIENGEATNVTLRNNILSQNESFQIAYEDGPQPPGYTIDHNLIDGFRDYPGELYGEASIEGDPLFVDALAFDLHILPGSPAIDAGQLDLAPANDLDGNVRPQDGNGDRLALPDLGADELPDPTRPLIFLPIREHCEEYVAQAAHLALEALEHTI